MVTLTYLIGELEQSVAGQANLERINITHICGRGLQRLLLGLAGRNSPFSIFLCKMTV